LLSKKLENHASNVYLVNTGWTGGAYGVGERMSIQGTRSCIDAILDGSIHDAEFKEDPIFGFQVPTELKGVNANVCNPKESWKCKKSYDIQAKKLATMFQENFIQYTGPGITDYTKFGPKV
jgi:phosphoenolpyruvate carboxykinase (ATP)